MEISEAASEDTLAAAVAAALERLIGLFRSLSPASGLSLTSAAAPGPPGAVRVVAAVVAGGPGGRDAAGHDPADRPAGGRGPGRPGGGSGRRAGGAGPDHRRRQGHAGRPASGSGRTGGPAAGPAQPRRTRGAGRGPACHGRPGQRRAQRAGCPPGRCPGWPDDWRRFMSGSAANPFRQPKAVFAVALACVVSFMGIGLVDPILPAISHQLNASPSEVTLLFTSYLVVTAVAMLITNWVSSRLGAKKTLIAGLIVIVVFSALAGASPSINAIIGFRAGWGVGNALFIATSLAVIVASASGGFAGAIVLYETALGVGIAIGPLLGGTLGEISWRGPFFGVSVLMAIALIATVVLVEPTPKPAHKTSLSAPLRALRHRGLLTMSLTALCYNWGFFTVLGYAPFPMKLSPIRLGLVFTGWGIFVALFAVFGAPRLQARLGIARAMYLNLAAFAVVVLVIAIWTTDNAVLIPAVIVSGIFIGVNNTITTQAVMTVSPVEKPVASAAYSFVRFIGGGLAPYAAGRLVIAINIHFPFFTAAGAIVAGMAILSTARSLLTEAERVQAEQVSAATSPDATKGVILAAVDNSPM